MMPYDLIGGCVWFLLSLLIVLGASHLGLGSFRQPEAGLFSMITGVILGGLSLLLMAESMFRPARARNDSETVWSKDTQWRRLLLTLAALVAYTLLLTTLGFLLTTFLFMTFLFRVIEPQRWSLSVLSGAASSLCGWMIFEAWLQCQLPEGFVLGCIRSLF